MPRLKRIPNTNRYVDPADVVGMQGYITTAHEPYTEVQLRDGQTVTVWDSVEDVVAKWNAEP